MTASRKLGRLGLRAGLVGFVALSGWWMTRSKPPSDWVTLEADRDAIVGRPLHVRAQVVPPVERGESLVVDLHWMNRRREPQGYLSGSAPQAVPEWGGSLEFDVAIPDRDQLGYVFAVIYAGRSGSWGDRTRAAFTDPVAVMSIATPSRDQRSVAWPVHDLAVERTIPPSPSRTAQWFAALLWLGAAGLCARRSNVGNGSSLVHDRADAHAGRLCVAACVAAACWEITSADTVLTDIVRRFAIDTHHYDQREMLQVALTATALACASWVFVSILDVDQRGGRRLVLTGLNLFAGASAIALISHHAIDRLANALWWSVPAIQWLKIASGGLALAGSARTPARDA